MMNNNDSEDLTKKSKVKIISDGRINRFGERLKIAMNGQKNVAFAKKCNMSERVIRDYLAGRTYPSLDRLADIAKASGRSIEWLATGFEIERLSNNDDNYIIITELTKSNTPIELKMNKQWLIDSGLINKHLALIRINGDSMSPTLYHNDIALIEMKNDWKDVSDGLYVINANGNYIIKRIQFDVIKNGYIIKNDNSAYNTEFISDIKNIHLAAKILKTLHSC